jgi:Fe(3+) dicitrate transport protein
LPLPGIADAVDVVGRLPDAIADPFNGRSHLAGVDGTSLYAGKKNDVLLLGRMDANLSSGNTRQVFAKIPGTNIWENDGSGLQVGISNRGLDPNRSWEMNSRQNGYDITADIFGYPEAYFTPPLEAVDRIEVVRGASSLQYGAQFGGLVNYVLKKAPAGRRFSAASEQTAGANGLFNSHNRVGGRIGDIAYTGYYHHRQGDGWRQNAGFDNHTAYGSVEYAPNDRLKVGVELTRMHSVVQMAGGLTDALFEENPRQSLRPRNWFALTWLLPSLKIEYAANPLTRVSVTATAIHGQRYSLFNADPVATSAGIVNADSDAKPRTLYNDRFNNQAIETRLVHLYDWRGQVHTLAAGFRYYHGRTSRQHGVGATGSEPQFEWLVPELDRDMTFTTLNLAGFAENAFHITPNLIVTPGLRFDRIDSAGEGRPIVGTKERTRLIPLAGVGATYRLTDRIDFYGNVTQAYRPTLFNDFWRPDPTIVVDPDLVDMTGYVGDFGARGRLGDWLSFDVGGFYLKYGHRLGLLTKPDATGAPRVYWTNISDSRNAGIESFVEADLLRLALGDKAPASLFVFTASSATSARYLQGAVRGNRVELAPAIIARSGVTYRRGPLSATVQNGYVSDQFTDATNTRFQADGIQGLIPAYRVWDLSVNREINRYLVVRAGANNITNRHYFTRRATSYPGPGVIPADGRSLQLTVGLRY